MLVQFVWYSLFRGLISILLLSVASPLAAQPTGRQAAAVGKYQYFLEGAQAHLQSAARAEALLMLDSAEQIRGTLRPDTSVAKLQLKIGRNFNWVGEGALALRLFTHAHAVLAGTGHPLEIDLYNGMGIAHDLLGDFPAALSHYQKALTIARQRNQYPETADILGNIAIIYSKSRDYPNAARYYKQAIALVRANQDTLRLANQYLNLGITFKQNGQWADAENAYRESLNSFKAKGYLFEQAIVYHNLGGLAFARQQYDQAIAHYRTSETLIRHQPSRQVNARNLLGISQAYLYLSAPDSAWQYGQAAHAQAQALGSAEVFEELYAHLALVLMARGQADSSWAYQVRYQTLRDSLLGNEKIRLLAEMETKYQTQLTEEENHALRQAQALQTETLARRRWQSYLLAAVALMLLIVSGQALVSRRRTQRYNAQLLRQNEDIRQQRTLIEARNQQLEVQSQQIQAKNAQLADINQELNGLMGVVAHDLRGPLNRVDGMMHLLPLAGPLNAEQETYVRMVHDITATGNRLIDALVETTRLEDTKPEVSRVSLRACLQELEATYQEMARRKDIPLVLSAPTEVSLHTDPQYVRRIIENLLSNALKFSPRGTRVEMGLRQTPTHADLWVSDQGPGIAPNMQARMFRRFQRLSNRPTGGETSSGLGLYIVRQLADQLGAHVVVTSAIGQGSTFTLRLPLEVETHTDQVVSQER